MSIMKWLLHLKTISQHKWLVLRYCFSIGLYWQGLIHDLSKYSPAEFKIGVKYFKGNRSPNAVERTIKGYSSAWLHHKGRNKHHWEYWIDYAQTETASLVSIEMPVKYVVEMFCDRVAASKIYRKKNYRDSDPYDYYRRFKDYQLMHPETRLLLEKMLICLKDKGEREAFMMIRKEILKRC